MHLTLSAGHHGATHAALSIDEALVEQACALNLDVAGSIARAVKAARERLWKIGNAAAIAAESDYVEKHGLPLAKYRQF